LRALNSSHEARRNLISRKFNLRVASRTDSGLEFKNSLKGLKRVKSENIFTRNTAKNDPDDHQDSDILSDLMKIITKHRSGKHKKRINININRKSDIVLKITEESDPEEAENQVEQEELQVNQESKETASLLKAKLSFNALP
jgi:hypothetical protein